MSSLQDIVKGVKAKDVQVGHYICSVFDRYEGRVNAVVQRPDTGYSIHCQGYDIPYYFPSNLWVFVLRDGLQTDVLDDWKLVNKFKQITNTEVKQGQDITARLEKNDGKDCDLLLATVCAVDVEEKKVSFMYNGRVVTSRSHYLTINMLGWIKKRIAARRILRYLDGRFRCAENLRAHIYHPNGWYIKNKWLPKLETMIDSSR